MRRNTNYTSFHYAIDDSSVWQGIEENRNSWNAGDGIKGKGNRKGIAIEICYSKSGGTKFDNAEILASKFIAEILERKGWGIEKVTKHQDYSGKYCPHRTLDRGWDRFLNLVKVEMSNWKDGFTKEEMKLYAIAEAYLYEMDTNKKIKTYNKGQDIGISYVGDDWYMTAYSYDKNIKNGFKVSEWYDGKDICEEEVKALGLELEAQKTQIKILEQQKEELIEINEQLNKYKDYFDKLSVLIETKI